jgi:hypothetical protein
MGKKSQNMTKSVDTGIQMKGCILPSQWEMKKTQVWYLSLHRDGSQDSSSSPSTPSQPFSEHSDKNETLHSTSKQVDK